ncbi:MAG: hypothetical protein OXJ54_13225 [Gemmatimonadetes bacterium]|nr:hypothetical protein [Candidatus Palauibacter rhopaloidicola]
MTRTLQLLGLLVIALLANTSGATAAVGIDSHPCIHWGPDCILCEVANDPDCIVILCNHPDGGIDGEILCW